MKGRLVSFIVCSIACAVALGSAALPAGARVPEKKQQPPLRVLVTNDDGVAAPGIDALVEGLREIPGVKVTVVAPATEQSGTGGKFTPGTLAAADAATASGYAAKAVDGYPGDTIVWALEQGGVKRRPDLVVSGINSIQNLGTLTAISGTVGAAAAAAARGVPALAVSQGILPDGQPDYASGVVAAQKWVKQHRKALTPKKGKDVDVVLENLNVPTCVTGEIRGLVDVPLAPEGFEGAVAAQDCESTLEHPTNDIEAFNNGFETRTKLPVPAPVTVERT